MECELDPSNKLQSDEASCFHAGFLQGKVYWAIQGGGAWVRDSTGQQRRLQCSEFSLDDPGLVVVGPHMHPQRQMQRVLRQLRQPKYRVAGSSLKMLMVSQLR